MHQSGSLSGAAPRLRWWGALQDITVPVSYANQDWSVTFHILDGGQEAVLAGRIAALAPAERTVGALMARLAMSVVAVDGVAVGFGETDPDADYQARYEWIKGVGTPETPGWPGPLIQEVGHAYDQAEAQPAVVKAEMALDPNSLARTVAPSGALSTTPGTSATGV